MFLFHSDQICMYIQAINSFLLTVLLYIYICLNVVCSRVSAAVAHFILKSRLLATRSFVATADLYPWSESTNNITSNYPRTNTQAKTLLSVYRKPLLAKSHYSCKLESLIGLQAIVKVLEHERHLPREHHT